jgi:hypothetical protein
VKELPARTRPLGPNLFKDLQARNNLSEEAAQLVLDQCLKRRRNR